MIAVDSRWEQLVLWSAPDRQVRRVIPVWQWQFRSKSFLVLEPSASARQHVYVEVIKDETARRANSFDDIPMTRVRLCSPFGGETIIPNSMALAHVFVNDTKCLELQAKWLRIAKAKPFCPPDGETAHSARAAHRSQMVSDGPPGPVLPPPASVETPPVLEAPTTEPEPPPTETQPEPSQPAAEEAYLLTEAANDSTSTLGTIVIVHRMSRQRREISVVGIYGDLVRVEWPMAGNYELSKSAGTWKSSPRSLLKLWEIDPDSMRRMELKILEEHERKKEAFKRQRYEFEKS